MGELISEEYRALNRTMHETKKTYGATGDKWLPRVIELWAQYKCTSLLDYGCGKGSLIAGLDGFDTQGYDPAIPGKDGVPNPADLVVCTDVLEHIEPDKIDEVLQHLARLTRKVALFSISIVSANKHLPDGRNAHILIRLPEWWREQLGRWFELSEWSASSTNAVCLGVSKFRELEQPVTVAAVDNDIRNEQARINCLAVPERLEEVKEPHGRKAILVCFGPSLKTTWPAVALVQANGADVVTVSGAHKFLIDRGVVPSFHTDCDPREHKARQFGEPHSGVRYWIASCVHPSYLARLSGFDTALWHLWNGDSSAAIWDYEPDAWMVVGASNAGLRALSLLYALGYRDVEIHGMDCSTDDEGGHAGAHLGKPQNVIRVKCRDRWFTTTALLAVYARQFGESLSMYPGMKIGLAGDGLLQYMTKGE